MLAAAQNHFSADLSSLLERGWTRECCDDEIFTLLPRNNTTWVRKEKAHYRKVNGVLLYQRGCRLPEICVPKNAAIYVLIAEHRKIHVDPKRRVDDNPARKYKGLTKAQFRDIADYCRTRIEKTGSCPFPLKLEARFQKYVEFTEQMFLEYALQRRKGTSLVAPKPSPPLEESGLQRMESCNAMQAKAAEHFWWVTIRRRGKTRRGNGIERNYSGPTNMIEQVQDPSNRWVPPCFQAAQAERLRDTIGSAYASTTRLKTSYIHHSVAIGSAMGVMLSRPVTFDTWSPDRNWLRDNAPEMPTLYMLYLSDDNCFRDALDFYDEVDHSASTSSCYPVKSEFIFAAEKIGDVEALDELARSAVNPWHQYRPTTCYDTRQCRMSGPSVHKRSHSSCCEGVILEPTKEQEGQLLCRSNGNGRSGDAHAPFWFHQEYIPSLRSWGELRVLIASVEDELGRRGRSGRVIGVFHTKFKPGEVEPINVSCITNRSLQHHGPLSELGGRVSLEDAEAFALYVYDQLRARPDWALHYPSLEVGVRIDIGVCMDGGLFVLEITREWFGDHFCHFTEEPQTASCWAIADARVARFSRGKSKSAANPLIAPLVT